MPIEGNTIQNPDLVHAMDLFLVNKSELNGKRMSKDLNRATFLVPISLPEDIPADHLEENLKNVEIRYLMLDQKSTGQSFLMAFTDREEMKKWNEEEVPAIFCPFSSLQEIVLKYADQCGGMVINPFHHSIVITAQNIKLP